MSYPYRQMAGLKSLVWVPEGPFQAQMPYPTGKEKWSNIHEALWRFSASRAFTLQYSTGNKLSFVNCN